MKFLKTISLFFLCTYTLLASSNWTERFYLQNTHSERGPLLSGSIVRHQNGEIDLDYGNTHIQRMLLNQPTYLIVEKYMLDTTSVGGGSISSLTRDNFFIVLQKSGLFIQESDVLVGKDCDPYSSSSGGLYSNRESIRREGCNDTVSDGDVTIIIVDYNPPSQQNISPSPQTEQPESNNQEQSSTCCNCCKDCHCDCSQCCECLRDCIESLGNGIGYCVKEILKCFCSILTAPCDDD